MNLPQIVIRALKKFKLLPFLNVNGSITLNNKKLVIPVTGGVGFDNLFMSEPWMTRLLLKLTPFFTGAFIDVGVNVGQTLLKTYAISDRVNYIGFEPNPVCNYYLQHLVRLNNIQNFRLIPVGISDKTGILKLNFFYSTETDASASVIDNFRPTEVVDHFSYVPVLEERHLGTLLPETGHCILKIDVEGAELEVLRTFSEWISRCQPLILVEILPVYSTDNEFRLKRQIEIETLLASWNYKIARIRKEEDILLTKINKIGIHTNIDDCDYVLYPADLEPGLGSLFDGRPESKPAHIGPPVTETERIAVGEA